MKYIIKGPQRDGNYFIYLEDEGVLSYSGDRETFQEAKIQVMRRIAERKVEAAKVITSKLQYRSVEFPF